MYPETHCHYKSRLSTHRGSCLVQHSHTHSKKPDFSSKLFKEFKFIKFKEFKSITAVILQDQGDLSSIEFFQALAIHITGAISEEQAACRYQNSRRSFN